jgi:hypothetical protein
MADPCFGLSACAGGTTLGIYEMEDAIAAVRWARKCRAGMKIGLIGTRCVVKRIPPPLFSCRRESTSFIGVCFCTSRECTSRQMFSKANGWVHGPASLKSLLLVNLSKRVMRSTGGVASILAASYDDMVRSSVACIVAENAFSSPESVARQTVSEVVFKVLVCKGSSTAFALVYPIMLMVKALSVIKVSRV